MRAVVADHPGEPEVLHLVQLPDPRPGPGQVLVAVECAAITFIDTQIRAGRTPGPGFDFPAVLGNGVGGVIAAVADDVDPDWIGTRVVTTTGGTGGYASLAVVPATHLHRLPDSVSTPEGTAVLADGRTAVGLHRAGQIRAGDTVVITAAAGGVGSLLVQLATASGATVIGLASSDTKLAQVRALGAHHAVDYTTPGWQEHLRALTPTGIDVTFDGVGYPVTEALYSLTRRGGRYLAHGAAGGHWGDIADADARGITVIPLAAIAGNADELFALVEEALHLTGTGILRPTIGQTYPLARATQAHAAIDARATIGKTLLIP